MTTEKIVAVRVSAFGQDAADVTVQVSESALLVEGLTPAQVFALLGRIADPEATAQPTEPTEQQTKPNKPKQKRVRRVVAVASATPVVDRAATSNATPVAVTTTLEPALPPELEPTEDMTRISRLNDAVVFLQGKGLTTVKEIAPVLEAWKAKVPLLSKIGNMEERVGRLLTISATP